MKYFKFIMGLLYLSIGLYLLFSPLEGKETMSYIIGGTVIAYGCMRAYMGYQELFGVKKSDQ
jgi:uncharacterized membrane protein HdeD (DUF308 family)